MVETIGQRKTTEETLEKDTQTRTSDQAQLDNEVAHRLIMLLIPAVQSSDNQSATCLLAGFYALYAETFHECIRTWTRDSMLSDEDINNIIKATFVHILQSLKEYKGGSRYGIPWMLTSCRFSTNQLMARRMGENRKGPSIEPCAIPDNIAVSDEADTQNLVINKVREEVIKQTIEHLSEEDSVERVKQAFSDHLSADGDPYIAEAIAEAELILREAREARLLQLDNSQTIDVKFSPNTTVESREIPAPTEVETMGRVEGQPISHPEAAAKTGAEPVQVLPETKPASPLVGLHKALEEAGAYKKIKKEKNRQVLQEYLTTEKPMGDLKDMAGVKTVDAVNHIVHRNLHKIFAGLTPEVQQEHGGSASEAIKRKASKQLQTQLSRERIKEGVAGKERVYTKPTGRPKGHTDSQPRKARELSDTHKQNLSESLKHYHQEQKSQQQIPPHEEHIITDLTKSSQER